jgi:hypothetical protein
MTAMTAVMSIRARQPAVKPSFSLLSGAMGNLRLCP